MSTWRYGCSSPGKSTVRDTGFETTATSLSFCANTTAVRSNRRLGLIISTLRVGRIQGHRPDMGPALEDGVDRGEDAECSECRQDQATDHSAAEWGRLWFAEGH